MYISSPCVAVCCTVRQVSVKHNYELTFVMKYVQTVLQAMENTRDRLNFVNNLMDMFKELVFDLHDYDAGQFSRLASVLPTNAVTALYFHHHGLVTSNIVVISPIVIIIVVIKVWLRLVSRSPALVLIQRFLFFKTVNVLSPFLIGRMFVCEPSWVLIGRTFLREPSWEEL